MTGPSDLLTDLQVDRHRPSSPAASAPAAAPPPVARVPALELRVTPLHWSLPSLRRGPTGWTAGLGPLQAALLLG